MAMPDNISRRKLLQTTAVAGAAFGSISWLGDGLLTMGTATAQSHISPKLVIPPMEIGQDIAGTQTYNLTLQNGTREFFPGIKTATSGINGSYLGPTLKIRDGKNIQINVTNNLGEISTLHWHGAHLPASEDGGPHQIIKPGQAWSPQFTVKQKAASLWYHPHLEGKTGEHVWRGMAGMIIVEDDEADSLNLPDTYGVDDIPLILQDRLFKSDGSMPYNPGMHFIMMGLTGNTPLTNGSIFPYFKAKTSLLRIRILNASNASFYNLGFPDNKPFKQIASDGGLLPEPVELTRIVLAPAERAEIVVEIKPREVARLRNFTWTAPNSGGMMRRQGSGMMSGGGVTPEFDFLEIRAAATLDSSTPLPAKLATVEKLDPKDVSVTRKFVLQMNMGPMVMAGISHSHLINNKVMEMRRIDETVKLGATEIWEISNESIMAHPFHIHDVQFQILDRNDHPPAPGERGRKDVVLVNPGERVRLIMRFEDYTDPNSPFMYHCHILEHEDAGMMGQFVVV